MRTTLSGALAGLLGAGVLVAQAQTPERLPPSAEPLVFLGLVAPPWEATPDPRLDGALPDPPLRIRELVAPGRSAPTPPRTPPALPAGPPPAACPEASSAPACAPPRACPPPDRGWVEADYLLWWVRRGPLPAPLVVTGPLTDPFPGALDQPGTSVLFGGSGLGYGATSGLRLGAGYWLGDDQRFAVEAGGFLLERRAVGFRAAADAAGNPVLGLSFVNALTGAENVYLSGFPEPPVVTGGVAVASHSRMWGWEVNAGATAFRSANLELSVLAGFRTLSLDEDLLISATFSTSTTEFLGAGAVLTPFSGATADLFRTNNRFYGGQVGGRLRWDADCLNVTLVGKVALGSMQESALVAGSSVVTTAGVAAPAVGGIYAQTSNIGRYSRQEFAVVPEVGVGMGLWLTRSLQARVGYDFLYVSSVARPGDLIDRFVNPNLVPTDPASFGTPGGPPRPAFAWRQSDFWAHGVRLGVEFRF